MALTKVPSNLDATIATTQSQADNSTNIATTAYVDLAVSSLSDSAPAALNTLNEIAAALGDDANYASTTTAAIAAKLPLAGGTMTGNLTVNAIVDADNFKINGGQGSDGQVLTSTGSGIAWEAIPAGGVAGIVTSANATAITIDSAETIFHKTTSPTLHSAVTGIVFENGSLLNDVTRGDGKSITLAQNLAVDSGNTWAYLAAGEGSYYQQFNGNHYFGTAASGSAGADATVNTKMLINSAGNVGIGTGSPSAPLDIVTDSVVYAAEFTQSKTSNGDGVLINIGSAAAADYALTVRSNAGNTSVLACKGDGKVGIGTFVPAKLLHLSETGDGTKLRITRGGLCEWDFSIGNTSTLTGVGAGALELIPLNAGTTNEFAIGLAGTTTPLFHLKNDQNYFAKKVGIGTTTPGNLLEISHSAGSHTPVLRLTGTSTSAYAAGLEWWTGYGPKQTAAMYSTASGSQGGEWWLQTRDQTSNTLITRMSINNAGDVTLGGGSAANNVFTVGRTGTGGQGAAHLKLKTPGASYMDWWDAGDGNTIRLYTYSVNLRMKDMPNGDDCIQFEAAGNIDIDGSYLTGGFDYAEYFESTDGTAIPVGTSVVLVNEKVRAATSGEQPLGVVRPGKDGTSVVGGSAGLRWTGKYLKDDYDAYLYDTVDYWTWKDVDDTNETGDEDQQCWSDRVPAGWVVPSDKTVTSKQRKRLNPDFVENLDADGNQIYVNREERDEWNCIGLLGQVPITKGQVINSNWTKLKDRSATVELWFIK
jgi:hypothetical protein